MPETGMSSTATQLMSGAIAGAFTESLLHPLDTLSTRLKVVDTRQELVRTARRIAAREGLGAYWRGVSVTLVLAPVSSAAYFLTYESSVTAGKRARVPSGIDYMLAGAAAELTASLVTAPHEVIKNRMQLGANPQSATRGLVSDKYNYGNAFQAAVGIVRTHGIGSLYAGWRASIVGDCLFSAIQFYVYETGKDLLRRHGASHKGENTVLSTLVDTDGAPGIHPGGLLLLGFAAGGVAAWATNPLEVICTRLMTQATGGTVRYSGILDAFAQIHAAGGVSALFSGALPRMIYCMPYSALHLGVYECCREMFTSRAAR